MKKALLAFAALATIATGVATKSYAADNGLLIQTQYYDDDGYRPPMPPRGGPRPGWDGPDRGPGRGPGWAMKPCVAKSSVRAASPARLNAAVMMSAIYAEIAAPISLKPRAPTVAVSSWWLMRSAVAFLMSAAPGAAGKDQTVQPG